MTLHIDDHPRRMNSWGSNRSNKSSCSRTTCHLCFFLLGTLFPYLSLQKLHKSKTLSWLGGSALKSGSRLVPRKGCSSAKIWRCLPGLVWIGCEEKGNPEWLLPFVGFSTSYLGYLHRCFDFYPSSVCFGILLWVQPLSWKMLDGISMIFAAPGANSQTTRRVESPPGGLNFGRDVLVFARGFEAINMSM